MKSRLSLKVVAGAKRTEFVGRHGDGWKLRIAAPPVDGKANTAIIRYLAKVTGLSQANIAIAAGQTSSNKIVEIEGIDATALQRAIVESHGPDSSHD